MRLEVMTCTRRSAETAALNSSQSAKPSPVDSRSERMAIGVREPSVDQRIVVPLKQNWPALPRCLASPVARLDNRSPRGPSPVSDAASKPCGEGRSETFQAGLNQFAIQEQDHVVVHIPAGRWVVNNLSDAHIALKAIRQSVTVPTRSPHQRRPPRLEPRP